MRVARGYIVQRRGVRSYWETTKRGDDDVYVGKAMTHWPDYIPSFVPDPLQHVATILDVLEGNLDSAREAVDGLELAGFEPDYCQRLRYLLRSGGEC